MVTLATRASSDRHAEGQQLRYCGVGAGYDEVFVDGSADEMKVRANLRTGGIVRSPCLQFVAYYAKAGTIVAVAR